MKKLAILLVLSVSVLSLGAQAQEALDIEKAIQIGLEKKPPDKNRG